MDVAAYLRRIGYRGALDTTPQTLRALHYAHLLAVPFENLDVVSGRTIALDEERLVHKIVDEGRGGFCYELNGAFACLLRALGFRVTLLSGRVPDHNHAPGPEFDHLALRVDCDGTVWLADVGFGECFLYPLPLRDGHEEAQHGIRYRLGTEGDEWQLTAKPSDGDWHLLYQFTVIPRVLDDFAAMCDYHQTSPASPFTNRRLCSRATPDGRVTLSDSRLIVTDGAERHETVIADDEHWSLTLETYFGIRWLPVIPTSRTAKKAGR